VSMLARRLVDSSDDDETRMVGQHILTAVDWTYRLVQDLLDVASIDAGRLSVELEPQAPHQIIESVVEMFAARAASQRVNLRMVVPVDACWVSADASRITQVLGNLVANSLRFTPVDGVVTLGARTDGGGVTFWVQDTGCGIPESELPRVFDRFWHARRGRAGHGTGLGLAIAQGIVRAHGCQISVESVVDRGSTFSFTIPLAQSSAVPTLLRSVITDRLTAS
jgi:signal transduction histidine kinase